LVEQCQIGQGSNTSAELVQDGNSNPAATLIYGRYVNLVTMELKRQEQIRRQEAAQQAIEQQSREKYNEITKGMGIDTLIGSDVLIANPFLYEGKVVGLRTQFDEMISRDEGLFDGGRLLVSSVPTEMFRQRAEIFLAGRVLGKKPIDTPMGGKMLLPHLDYVGTYLCQQSRCNEVFLWQH
jgi:hypothetical protein